MRNSYVNIMSRIFPYDLTAFKLRVRANVCPLCRVVCTHVCTYVHTYVCYSSNVISMSHIRTCVHTVKPVYNDHSRDQVFVVSVDRWSLYEGALVQPKWTMSQTTVVSVDRWSLYVSVRMYIIRTYVCTGSIQSLYSVTMHLCIHSTGLLDNTYTYVCMYVCTRKRVAVFCL